MKPYDTADMCCPIDPQETIFVQECDIDFIPVLCVYVGIPMEEEEDEQDTSIKGRLLALVYKIKGQPLKTEEEPTEQEQQAPCKTITSTTMSEPAIT